MSRRGVQEVTREEAKRKKSAKIEEVTREEPKRDESKRGQESPTR